MGRLPRRVLEQLSFNLNPSPRSEWHICARPLRYWATSEGEQIEARFAGFNRPPVSSDVCC